MTETVTDSTNVEEELLSFWNYIFPLNASAMPHVLISTQIRLVRTFVLIILTLLQLETDIYYSVYQSTKQKSPFDM